MMSANMPYPLASRSAKTKVMRLNTNQSTISTEQTVIVDVKSYTYLGAIITTSGGTNEDISRSNYLFIGHMKEEEREDDPKRHGKEQ